MELRRVEYFMVVARHLHFGRAATEIGIAQPGLSQQIKALEKEMQVTLLERDRRSVSLTPAGEVLYLEAGNLLETRDLVRARVQEAAAQGTGGVLRVAYTRSGADMNIGELVREFSRLNPEVEVETHTGWTSWNLELLQHRKIDAAFVRGPVQNDAIQTFPVGAEELVVALPEDHPLAAQEEVHRELLRDEPVVLWHRHLGPTFYDQLVEQVWPDGGPKVVLQEPEAEQILAAVAGGIGVSVLDRRRSDKLRPKRGVVLLPFAGTPPTVSVELAWRSRDRSHAVCAFVAWCRRQSADRESDRS